METLGYDQQSFQDTSTFFVRQGFSTGLDGFMEFGRWFFKNVVDRVFSTESDRWFFRNELDRVFQDWDSGLVFLRIGSGFRFSLDKVKSTAYL